MLSRAIFRIALLLSLSAASAALAQGGMSQVTDTDVENFMDLARNRLHVARLLDGSFVPPETPEERRQPLLPLADGRRVVERGVISALAQWCGMAWSERSYMPFMRGERRRQIWSDNQIAYIGLLHGTTLGAIGRSLQRTSTCTDQHRTNLEALLTRVPL